MDTIIPVYLVNCFQWEEVSATVAFFAGHNRDGGCGGPAEGVESVCARQRVRK